MFRFSVQRLRTERIEISHALSRNFPTAFPSHSKHVQSRFVHETENVCPPTTRKYRQISDPIDHRSGYRLLTACQIIGSARDFADGSTIIGFRVPLVSLCFS